MGVLIDYLHEIFFFGIIFILIWAVLKVALKTEFAKLSGVIAWSSLLVIFPPLIDMLKTGGSIYWSFYLLGSISELKNYYLTIFGNLPPGIYYFGTKIIFLLAIVFVSALVFAKSKSFVKTAVSAVAVYTIFFLMGAFPSFFAFAYYFVSGKDFFGNISAVQIMQLLGGMEKIFGLEFAELKFAMAYNINLIFYPIFLGLLCLIFFIAEKGKFLAVIKNLRLPQVIVHGGLFFIGLGIGLWTYPQNLDINIFSVAAALDLLIAIFLAWAASVIINDISDFSTDAVSNPKRPLQEKIFNVSEYKQLGIVLFLLSLLGGLVVSPKFAALLAVYQFLAWAYSAEPFRLKKFPLVATFISSSALLIVLFAGFALASGDNNLAGLSWRIILLLLISFTLALPLKDFRDIEGDRRDKIWTIPVIFGEKNGRLISAAGIFIPFILSVFILNESRLFWWAVLSGSASFLVIMTKKPCQLFWWVLGVAAVYGVVLVKAVFF